MSASAITVLAHAKINLTLEVLQRLPSGYHEIRSVMQQVELHDEVQVMARVDELICLSCDRPGVPLDESNLAWKAAELLRQKFDLKQGVQINIHKRIPVAGGMAGGSSNAAAALQALNQLWELKLSERDLLLLAADLGMDVPFCILGGTALAVDRGQIVYPLPPAPPWWVVMANPGFGISTREAYQSLDLNRPHQSCSEMMIDALASGQFAQVNARLYNDFETVIEAQKPIISQIKEKMRASGASHALLSGSGPSVFCLLEEQSAAQQVAHALQDMLPYVSITHLLQKTPS